MKALLFLYLICSVTNIPGYGQNDAVQSDFDVAKRLINQPAEDLITVIKKLNFETYITVSNNSKILFYLLRGESSVRTFELKIGNIYDKSDSEDQVISENICIEVFVRYYHENLNDLHDFFSYEVPDNTKYVSYEKSLGEQRSHLRIMMNNL